jgi:hypothetical protein
MTSAPRAIVIGILLGLIGAAGQFFLLLMNSPQTPPLRGLLTFGLAVLIGTLAGFTAKNEALKAASLTGFVAGALVSSVGIGLIIRNPNLLGDHPFASAETALSFLSAILAGSIISSWLVAGVAVLVALPISQTIVQERKRL